VVVEVENSFGDVARRVIDFARVFRPADTVAALTSYAGGRPAAAAQLANLADFAHGVAGRELEDDALIAFRMSAGTIGRLWASCLAIGRPHGLTLQVFGETGGLRWQQEQPNQLYWTPLGEPTRILERGAAGLSAAAERANRIATGHPEGMPLAFANIYRDLAEVIQAQRDGISADPLAGEFPTAADGCHSIELIFAAAESAQNGSRWVDVR
jgi:predicted dehydrogenase